MKYILFVLIMMASIDAFPQADPPYRIFDKKGKETSESKMFKKLIKSQVIFFGELHDDPIAHTLELQMARTIFEKDKSLMIGLEMFEADVQVVLDEYLNGHISEKYFLNDSRPWPNYETDYRPIIEFAKDNQIRVWATNIPRRYANLVYRAGLQALDSVSYQAKQWIALLPIEVDFELPGYKHMATSMEGHGAHGSGTRLVEAQAIKDATMAHFILQNLETKFLHMNGSFHSRNNEGIIWYLKKWKPGLTVATIETVRQEDTGSLLDEHKGVADFIICIKK